MVNKEVSPGIPGLYQVYHKDGTSSFLGDTRRVRKNQPFAYRNSSTPLSEATLIAKLQEAVLPIRGKPTDILGWGGDSVCFRITDGNSRYAAVLRSNREPENWKHLMDHWKREQDINKAFSPRTIPQHIMIVNGIDNQPAVLKVTPEVPGAPMSEVSGAYLFANKQLMEQYIDITKGNLRRFVATGIIADPIGHIKSNRFSSLFERYGLFFFNISNFMVDFQRNSLVVVDCESDDLKRLPPHRKVQLFSRAFGMVVNIAILEAFRGVNSIRDKIFSDPSSKTEVDNISGTEQLNQGFAEAVNLFNASGLDYRIVGSFSTAATINSAGGDYHLTPYRSDRTIRDIDILVLDQDQDYAKRLADEFNAKREQNPFYPRIELSLPKVFEEDKGYPESRPAVLPLIVTRLAMDRLGNFYLVYSGKHTQIPTAYLDPICQAYEGVKFPTLEPGVLAGLYITRMGVFKFKDVEKITTLLALTKAQISVEFLDFAKILRTNWPGLYKNSLIRELMYYFSGGLIRKGLLSSLKSKFSRKGVFSGADGGT
ncbi:hypothetical protein HYU95_05475 [Candidatus Daviesbacteria bacterium]|nr:hypothetical protein [Candidatus Daviesbacteria bacterium]